MRCFKIAVAVVITASLSQVQSQADDNLRTRPISKVRGKVGDLLRMWWKQGTAAGNVGDFYDNRDGGHSKLRTAPYPQLQRITYSPDEIKRRQHWAAARKVRPGVVFGNSSTSAPLLRGGSNIRQLYSSPAGLALLYRQYRGNNLYIYPEHRDHDVGHNGVTGGKGYGDVYPTNTPYLIASQGSSGSDRPFMRAMASTLAAFRPAVKKKLIETGLLMPTVQMILRASNERAAGKRYLSGAAHPTVFVGSGNSRQFDELKMVETAHAIRLNDIPPMIQLKVVREDKPVAGIDYFDPRGETLGDTPAAIARIYRGKNQKRKIVISAEASFDVNKRPLTYHWVVLRGDASRIDIKPLNTAKSVAEIIVPFHDRRPIAEGNPLESNRVDIGVFVRNGKYYSAPGFVTFFSLDHESRAYDKAGNIMEIGYGGGTATVSVVDWPAFLKLAEGTSPVGRLLNFTDAQRQALRKALPELRKRTEALREVQAISKSATAARLKALVARKATAGKRVAAQQAHATKPTAETKDALTEAVTEFQAAEASRKKADEAARQAKRKFLLARKAQTDVFNRRRKSIGMSLRRLADHAINRILDDPKLTGKHVKLISARYASAGRGPQASVQSARQRLVAFGLVKLAPSKAAEFASVVPIGRPLTTYYRAMLRRYHVSLLSHLILMNVVKPAYRDKYVDPRIAFRKSWRDVYRYDKQGRWTGWTRYTSLYPTEFNTRGLVVIEKDKLGRCTKARTVKYRLVRRGKATPSFGWLEQIPGDKFVRYRYKNDVDVQGEEIHKKIVEEPRQ